MVVRGLIKRDALHSMLLGGHVVVRLVAARSLGCGPNRLRRLLANTRWLLRSTIRVGICVMPWDLTGLSFRGRRVGWKGADAQVLLESNEVSEGCRISIGRNPEPLVPQRRRQLMPSRHWQGMRGIGCAQRAEEIEFTALSVHPVPHLVVGKPVDAREIDRTAVAVSAGCLAAPVE
jgi:hypothetical protein